MGKIPYLFRRKNVFYFRLIVPIELQTLLDFTQVTVSLKTQKTQNSEEAISKALLFASRLKSYLYDVNHGNRSPVERSVLVESLCSVALLDQLNDFGLTALAKLTLKAVRHWTDEQKAAQALAIQAWKPWEKSTGPITEQGKATVAMKPAKAIFGNASDSGNGY